MRHLVLPSASEGSTRLDVFPLAETVRWKGRLLPRYAWYMLSGAVCDVGQFLMYKTLWTSLGLPTFSWTAAYLLSIAMRQESHKVFVFGHYDGSWFKNLCRFYCVYFITVATSMPVNLVLVRLMACLPAQVLDFGIAQSTYAYFGTTLYTGLFSYLRLKANWRRPGSPMKVSRSGLDLGILPSGNFGGAQLKKASAFSKYQVTSPTELSRRGAHRTNPCLESGSARPKHVRNPSWGSEYSKLVTI